MSDYGLLILHHSASSGAEGLVLLKREEQIIVLPINQTQLKKMVDLRQKSIESLFSPQPIDFITPAS